MAHQPGAEPAQQRRARPACPLVWTEWRHPWHLCTRAGQRWREYGSRRSKLLSSPETRTVAFMDIGTNSIRLLLVRFLPNHSYTILTQLKQMVRLGEGEFTHQHLQPQAMARAVLVAKQFAGLARAHGADEIIAVATAATREADNQYTFITRLQDEAQLDVRVVSGPEEARLIYLGVSSGIHLGDRQAFFIDIGGGSTEVIIGTQHQHSYIGSLKLGAIRLT